ncbi:MAG TPA: hypothetical protein VHJ17_22055 [Thermomonospora sp.]|nr:hypothetical protein [Thermomonospora sp.]
MTPGGTLLGHSFICAGVVGAVALAAPPPAHADDPAAYTVTVRPNGSLARDVVLLLTSERPLRWERHPAYCRPVNDLVLRCFLGDLTAPRTVRLTAVPRGSAPAPHLRAIVRTGERQETGTALAPSQPATVPTPDRPRKPRSSGVPSKTGGPVKPSGGSSQHGKSGTPSARPAPSTSTPTTAKTPGKNPSKAPGKGTKERPPGTQHDRPGAAQTPSGRPSTDGHQELPDGNQAPPAQAPNLPSPPGQQGVAPPGRAPGEVPLPTIRPHLPSPSVAPPVVGEPPRQHDLTMVSPAGEEEADASPWALVLALVVAVEVALLWLVVGLRLWLRRWAPGHGAR